MKEFIIKMLTAGNAISSKRVCGVLGWVTCLGMAVYCLITNALAPEITNIILYCCLGLLGVDSFINIFKK